MRVQDSNGVTLLELLLVVAMIGVIIAVAIPGVLRARQAGNESSAAAAPASIK